MTTAQIGRQLSLKNACVSFMFAYQQRNIDKMLSYCDPGGLIVFKPLGSGGKGSIMELGRGVWSSLIEAFPDLDNTVDAAIAEDGDSVRCQVVIRGTQAKDFAGIANKGKQFESDHIFIFHLNGEGMIDKIIVDWDHEDFCRQLGVTPKSRSEKLHEIARDYVLKGLGKKNFNAIPYHEEVGLRAPLCPGGNENRLAGKKNLLEQWWAPLPNLLKGVDLIDTYVNKSETAVTVEFWCHIAEPSCTLRIIDRFTIDDDGLIREQENFFDPRDVTDPGWRL